MNFSPISSPHLPASCFSPLSVSGLHKDSPSTPLKRPNTAPEIFSGKLPPFSTDIFSDKKLSESIDDDESHFIHRTVSPIYTGSLFISPHCVLSYLIDTNIYINIILIYMHGNM